MSSSTLHVDSISCFIFHTELPRYQTGTAAPFRFLDDGCLDRYQRLNYILWIEDLLDTTSENYADEYDPNRHVVGLDMYMIKPAE